MYLLSRFLLIVLRLYKFGKLDYCAISYDCIAATVAHSICSSFELLADQSHDLSQAKKKTAVKAEQIHRMTTIFTQKGQKLSF